METTLPVTVLQQKVLYHTCATVNVIFRPYGRIISCPCAIFRPCDVASHVIESHDTPRHNSNRSVAIACYTAIQT